MASLGAAAAARYRTDTNGIDDPGHATNADRRSAGAWARAGAALLLTMLLPLAVFPGEIRWLPIVVMLTGAFAVVGVVGGLARSIARKRPHA